MRYVIFDGGKEINRVVAEIDFMEAYCAGNGYTYEKLPEPAEPVLPEPTPAEQREEAYNTLEIVAWDGEQITVTHAAELWAYYAAEDNEKAGALTARIAAAKARIRELYPDEGGDGA